jgi:hypothetical protein
VYCREVLSFLSVTLITYFADIKQIEQELQQLSECFVDVALEVNRQGEDLNVISSQTSGAVSETSKGTKEIEDALNYTTSARKKKVIIFVLLIVLLLVIAGIVVGSVCGSTTLCDAAQPTNSTATTTTTTDLSTTLSASTTS